MEQNNKPEKKCTYPDCNCSERNDEYTKNFQCFAPVDYNELKKHKDAEKLAKSIYGEEYFVEISENQNAMIDILNESIWNFARMNGKMPEGIIMHPVDFEDIEKELLIPRVDKNDVKIFGLKIYRSYDQKEGNFKLI